MPSIPTHQGPLLHVIIQSGITSGVAIVIPVGMTASRLIQRAVYALTKL